ncbi:uncharacterized protein LOC126660480 [Mercurialis annua]|uniref:uncharacterized protein LOC126660480 n=1 Tax=Mercurialis annua TaxID=3986 RepID=UPI0024AF54C5|nr:uncharacterized protein LOC126660480 [Mercurialis annua]
MDRFAKNLCMPILLLLMVIAMANATSLSYAKCTIKKYKMCYNVERACPSLCPNSCIVDCASCESICMQEDDGYSSILALGRRSLFDSGDGNDLSHGNGDNNGNTGNNGNSNGNGNIGDNNGNNNGNNNNNGDNGDNDGNNGGNNGGNGSNGDNNGNNGGNNGDNGKNIGDDKGKGDNNGGKGDDKGGKGNDSSHGNGDNNGNTGNNGNNNGNGNIGDNNGNNNGNNNNNGDNDGNNGENSGNGGGNGGNGSNNGNNGGNNGNNGDNNGDNGKNNGDDNGKGDNNGGKGDDKGGKGDDNDKNGKNNGDDKGKGDDNGNNNDGHGKGSGDKSPPTPSPSPPTPTPSPSPPPTPTPSTPSPPPPPPTPTPSSPPPPTPSTPTPTPSIPSTSPKTATCKNSYYPHCYNTKHVCPSSCPGGCEVDCVTCKPVCKCDRPGAVCQDPRFIGGDGLTFYFHGKKDRDFCLVSNSNLHINAHFIGKRNKKMARDFTWVQSIAILFDNHQIFLGALKTSTWDESVDRLSLSFDGEPLTLLENEGSTWQSSNAPGVLITRSANTNNVIIEVEGNFKITAKVVPITEQDSRVHNYGITKDDCFAHLDLGFKFYSLSDQVNGVLGQTYGPGYVSRVKIGAKMPVMGGNKEFQTSSLVAPDCAVARFAGVNGNADEFMQSLELPSLSCASGIDGHGVVCKR